MKNILTEQLFEKILYLRSCSGNDLLKQFPHYTKQGVYKALRSLEAEGKILWQKRVISINLLWASQQIESLSSLFDSQLYSSPKKDKLQIYNAKTLDELDLLYSQLFITLSNSFKNQKNRSYLFYDIHNYTYLHKRPLVNWYINRITKESRKIKLLVGSMSPLDKEVTKEMNGLEFYHITKKWNYFLTVFDDIIIKNHLDKKILKMIDTLFENSDIKKSQLIIQDISKMKGSFKITVEKNEEKAKEIRNIFSKYFKL